MISDIELNAKIESTMDYFKETVLTLFSDEDKVLIFLGYKLGFMAAKSIEFSNKEIPKQQFIKLINEYLSKEL